METIGNSKPSSAQVTEPLILLKDFLHKLNTACGHTSKLDRSGSIQFELTCSECRPLHTKPNQAELLITGCLVWSRAISRAVWTAFWTKIELVCVVWAWCRMCLYHAHGSSSSSTRVASFCLCVIQPANLQSLQHVLFAVPYQTTTVHMFTCNRTVFTTHHTQLCYVTVYCSRYTNYSVNMFLGSNWNHTVSIVLSSICSVTTLKEM